MSLSSHQVNYALVWWYSLREEYILAFSFVGIVKSEMPLVLGTWASTVTLLKPATIKQVSKLIPGREDPYDLEEPTEYLPEVWSGSKTSPGVGTIHSSQGAGGWGSLHTNCPCLRYTWWTRLECKSLPRTGSHSTFLAVAWLLVPPWWGCPALQREHELPKVLECLSGDDRMLCQKGPDWNWANGTALKEAPIIPRTHMQKQSFGRLLY